MSMKNPLTPAGIEPAIFRFVEQHLNHFATAVPITSVLRIILLSCSFHLTYVTGIEVCCHLWAEAVNWGGERSCICGLC